MANLTQNFLFDRLFLLHQTLPVRQHFFFFNDTAPTEIYPLPLHHALPISRASPVHPPPWRGHAAGARLALARAPGPGPAKPVIRPGRSPQPAASLSGAPLGAAAALLLCVAGCSLISLKTPERPLSSRDLNARILTREFSYHFIAVEIGRAHV